jgi:hypothetical protein
MANSQTLLPPLLLIAAHFCGCVDTIIMHIAYDSVLPRAPCIRESLPARVQNEFRSPLLFAGDHVRVLDGRFTKMRHVIHALLDIILRPGVFILDATTNYGVWMELMIVDDAFFIV